MPTDKSSKAEIDAFNRTMRSAPWYQQWFASQGLDPNNVKLTQAQRAQLEALAIQNGVPKETFQDLDVDPSGNIGKEHGFHSLPTWAKVLAIGGAGAAGGLGAAAALGGAGAVSGGAAAGSSAASGGAAGGAAAGGGLAGGLGTASTILGAAQQVAPLLSAASAGRAAGRVAEAGINQNQDASAVNMYRAQLAGTADQNAFNQNAYTTGLGENQNENTFNQNRFGQDLSASNAKNSFGLSRAAQAVSNAGMDLNQRQFALSAPGQRAGNAVRGDILSAAKDVSFSGLPSNIKVPTISGGLRPSMFSADTKALGSNMTAQALREQQRGDIFAPLPDLPSYEGPTTGLPSYQKFAGAPPAYVAPPSAPTLTSLPQAGKTDSLLNAASVIGNLAPTFTDYLSRYKKKPGLVEPQSGSLGDWTAGQSQSWT